MKNIHPKGEPACAPHRLKGTIATPFGNFKKSVEPAAPSPLQATEQEMADMNVNDKPCRRCGDTFTPTGARSSLCDTCKEPKPKKSVGKPRKERTEEERIAFVDVLKPKTGEEVMRLHGFEAPVVTLKLSQNQVEKLLALLLA